MANNFNIIAFLKEYQRYPCLWDKSNADFRNRVKREHAEKQLLQITRGIGNSTELRRKIRSIRSVFFFLF